MTVTQSIHDHPPLEVTPIGAMGARISGIDIGAIVATAATDEPVTAPNPAQPATEVMASPPGNHPNHFCTQSYRSTASFEW